MCVCTNFDRQVSINFFFSCYNYWLTRFLYSQYTKLIIVLLYYIYLYNYILSNLRMHSFSSVDYALPPFFFYIWPEK